MQITSIILAIMAVLSILTVEANAGCGYKAINTNIKIYHKSFDDVRHRQIIKRLGGLNGQILTSNEANIKIFKSGQTELAIGPFVMFSEDHDDILDKLMFAIQMDAEQLQNIVRTAINKNKISEEELTYHWLPQITDKILTSEWFNFHGGTFQQLRPNNYDQIVIKSLLDPSEKMKIEFHFGKRSYCI